MKRIRETPATFGALLVGTVMFSVAGSAIERAAGLPGWALPVYTLGIIVFLASRLRSLSDRIRELESRLEGAKSA